MASVAVPIPQFKDMFNTPGLPVEISGGEQRGHIAFTPENYNCKYAWIKGAVFFEQVDFENVNLGIGIKFQNCHFLKGISFKNCRAEGYEREFNSDSGSVYFDQCEIALLNLPVVNFFERGFKVFNKSKITNLNIDDLQIPNGSLRIDESSVEERFRFSNVVVGKNGEIALVKSNIKSSIRCENLIAGSIGFLNSTVDGDVYLWSGSTSSLVFNNGKFNDDFVVKGLKSEQTSIISAEFSKEFSIDFDDNDNEVKGYHRNVFLLGNKFGQLLDVNGNSEQVIEKLTISNNRSQEGTIQFTACSVKEALLSGDLKNGNIRFDTCDFEKLQFSGLTNSATISLAACSAIEEADSLFEVENSNLGKFELLNSSLESFSKVRITDSILIELIPVGVDWFEDSNLEVSFDNTDHKERREIYRQLKQVYDKQGDRIQALEFQALELVAFRKEIKENKGWFDKDRWILRFSKTNDFGLNWMSPIYWVVGLTVLVFFPLIVACASPELSPWPSWHPSDWVITFKVLWKHIDVLPQLFNPARWTFRLFPDVEQRDLGFGTHFWDGLQRIVLAFFIVQIVSAFRKYVKN
jgi:hypothetical protein